MYQIDEATGGLEVTHRLALSSRDFAGDPGPVGRLFPFVLTLSIFNLLIKYFNLYILFLYFLFYFYILSILIYIFYFYIFYFIYIF